MLLRNPRLWEPTMNWTRIAASGQLEDDETLGVVVEGRKIALVQERR